MQMGNQFSIRLKELIRHSGIKQQSIANATGYDLSYVSKWLSGRMLPSEKTIESTIRAISLCIGKSLDSCDRDWFEESYNIGFEKITCDIITQDLLNNYAASKGTIDRNNHDYYNSLPSKTFFKLVYNHIEESDNTVIVVDLFGLDRESRQLLIGIKDGYYTRNTTNSGKTILLYFCASRSRDVCYDAISLIHLITVYSLYSFSLINSIYAFGKCVVIGDDRIDSGLLMGDSDKVFFVATSTIAEDELRFRTDLLKGIDNNRTVYSKKDMTSFVKNRDYFKSMLSTNIKWVQGHMTELIMPDLLHERLLGVVDDMCIEEMKRVHLLSKNIIEQESTTILIYESALSDLIATREVDYYNHKVMLNPNEVQEFIQFLIDLAPKYNIYLIGAPLFPEFKHAYSPCLYISDTICYMRIEGSYERESIFEISDRDVRRLFEQMFDCVVKTRDDVVITDKRVIEERLMNYRDKAGVMVG